MYDSNSTCIILYFYSNYYNNIVILPTHYVAYINVSQSEETCRIKSLRLFTERTRKLAEQRASVYVSNGRTKVGNLPRRRASKS